MLTKAFLSFICLWLIALTSFGQSALETNESFDKMPVESIKLKEEHVSAKQTLPFKHVEILDVRADTSFFGFLKGTFKGTSKLNFPNGLTDCMHDYINSHYMLQAGSSELPGVLLCIRKLWLSNTIDTTSTENLPHDWLKGLMVKVEAYANFDGEYKPITRVEFEHIVPFINKSTLQEQTDSVVNRIMEEVALRAAKIKKGGSMLTLKQIEAFNNGAFNVPILKDASLVKGVYNNYEEFKKNDPAHKIYNVQNGSLGDMLYVTGADGKEFPFRNAWGYCDGKNVYIKLAENYYRLYRSGNTFNLFGAKQITRGRAVKVENILLLGLAAGAIGKQNKKTTYNIIIKPLQLDIATGEVY